MSKPPAIHVDLRAPVIALILAATAVPVGIRPPVGFDHSIGLYDFLQNVAGYLPLGMVLNGLRWHRALMAAAGLSLLAESLQCLMPLRDPSFTDVIANTAGAAAGYGLAKAVGFKPLVTLRSWMAAPALLIAAGVVWLAIENANPDLNGRGSATAGTLEAHWAFDEADGPLAVDSGPNGLNGVLHGKARRVRGPHGSALSLGGKGDYVVTSDAMEFRMTGSLTVSAWINIRSNPQDDAVIVSDLDGDGPFSTGFQLDTTVDTGPRTVGFKLGDSCGRYFARYGATPLLADRWYLITGTYDSAQRTIDVYLDGKQDDGRLDGVVPDSRRHSRKPLRIGRRTESELFDFSGLIADVRIYSRALSEGEVAAAFAAKDPSPTMNAERRVQSAPVRTAPPSSCVTLPDPRGAKIADARLPTVVACFGVLISIAILALFSRGFGPVVAIAAGAIGGYVVLHFATFALPVLNLVTFPLTGAIAALCVVASRKAASK